MALTLGKSFNRRYDLRISFVDGHYNIGVFFNKHSSFLLFKVDPDFSEATDMRHSVKINMFKNLESSRFCATFLNLHNYRKTNLDILNQFDSIKSDYHLDINFVLNETINLSKVEYEDRVFFDTLSLYGFCLTSYVNEFLFIIAERQNINRRLSKKIVRTTGVQISTARALTSMHEFFEESLISGREGTEIPNLSNNVIKLSEEDAGGGKCS